MFRKVLLPLVLGAILFVGWSLLVAHPHAAPAVKPEPILSFQYAQTLGVTGEPYPFEAVHLNHPNGITVDSADNLYVAEDRGMRVLQYDSTGQNTLTIGPFLNSYETETYFPAPKAIAVDASGNLWITVQNAIRAFNPAGQGFYMLPDDPWVSNSDNAHFSEPRDLVFDSTGLLYVVDKDNHRIQVYAVVSDTLVYSSTIGEAGVPGADNDHFYRPQGIAVDSLDRVYVLDTDNHRVQRCEFAAGWTCTTFFGETGVPGDDLDHLGWTWESGLAFHNDLLYIADGSNYRVLQCNLSAECTLFAGETGVQGQDAGHFGWPNGVAVDSSGNVYVSDAWHMVKKFNSSGVFQSQIGIAMTPYDPGATHYNAPWGLTAAPDGSLFITEDAGYRVIKLDATGTPVLTLGQAGMEAISSDDNTRFGDWWAGPGGRVALDAAGNIYVPDTGNHRVQIFTPEGVYSATMGISREGGSDNDHFGCPRTVAISPVNGDIFVTDTCNQRIQVFTSARTYKMTVGVTEEPGADNLHFNGPRSIAIDGEGHLFVADTDNTRIQKCTLTGTSYACTTFAGLTGEWGDDFARLNSPHDVTVDAAGRVYVMDYGNWRVQVFGPDGLYLTTLGGSFGTRTSQMWNPVGIAVASDGTVFVSDRFIHRIQTFVPTGPDWAQMNLNGFGDPTNRGVTALEAFNGHLYAAVSNWQDGAQLWRMGDVTWTPVSDPGFSNVYTHTNPAIPDLIVFDGQLYAGTGWGSGQGQIWRSTNGTTWNLVENGFGNPGIGAITNFAVFQGKLYAGAQNAYGNGAEIWRSDTGNSGTWTPVVTGGLGDPLNQDVTGFMVFDNALYTALEQHPSSGTGAKIWRTTNGTDWTAVVADGFGSPDNQQTGGFAVYNGALYIGTRNDVTGGQIWRTHNGTDWTQTMGNGFGDSNNLKIEALLAIGSHLYAVTGNEETGAEVWRTINGTDWVQINPDGFGDSNNFATLWSSASAVFDNALYIGTWNDANGGELWRILIGYPVYLPVIVR